MRFATITITWQLYVYILKAVETDNLVKITKQYVLFYQLSSYVRNRETFKVWSANKTMSMYIAFDSLLWNLTICIWCRLFLKTVRPVRDRFPNKEFTFSVNPNYWWPNHSLCCFYNCTVYSAFNILDKFVWNWHKCAWTLLDRTYAIQYFNRPYTS